VWGGVFWNYFKWFGNWLEVLKISLIILKVIA